MRNLPRCLLSLLVVFGLGVDRTALAQESPVVSGATDGGTSGGGTSGGGTVDGNPALISLGSPMRNDGLLRNDGPMRNDHLRNQLKANTARSLPKTDTYAVAMNGTAFWHWTGADSYYHSGYWLDIFGEMEPAPGFVLNVRWSILNPALSYGYTATNYNFVRPAFTWYDQITPDLRASVVAGDLGRQTLGLGLLLEEKDMGGAKIMASYGDFYFAMLRDGTGGYFVNGDLETFTLEYRGPVRVGLQYGYIIMDENERKAGHFPLTVNDPFGTAYLSIPFFSLAELGTEWGWRFPDSGKIHSAGMVKLGVHKNEGDLYNFKSWVQWRHYQDGFASGWRTRIEHDYLSFEHLDKNYLATENIFSVDDAADTTGARIHFDLFPHRKIQASIDHEWGTTKYHYYNRDIFHFHREAITYCPQAPKENCVSFLYANKVVDVDTLPNINDVDLAKPYFKTLGYLGLEAAFQL